MKTGVWGGTPQKTLSPGGNDYIRKPFSMEELIARIQNILQITQATNPSPTGRMEGIPLGSYRFFPIQQELHLDGEIRKLSYRETQLPGILAAAPQRPRRAQGHSQENLGRRFLFQFPQPRRIYHPPPRLPERGRCGGNHHPERGGVQVGVLRAFQE